MFNVFVFFVVGDVVFGAVCIFGARLGKEISDKLELYIHAHIHH